MLTRFYLSFPIKMAICFSFISFTVSAPILYYLYNFSYGLVLISLQNRIKDLGKAGLLLFSKEHIYTLKKLSKEMEKKIDSLSEEDFKKITELEEGDTFDILSEEENKEIYSSNEYQEIIQILRKIKAASAPNPILLKHYKQKFYDANNKPFLRFAYILAPIAKFPEYDYLKFLADADMEEEDINNNGKIDIDETAMLISTIFNVKHLIIKNSIIEKKITCEDKFNSDQWGIWLSCYIPMFNNNQELIGILGLDLDVKSENNKLSQLRNLLVILLFVLAFGIGILSFFLSKIISKPIIKLSKASIEVSNKNFNIELPIRSRDEIGILTKNFNLMVKEIKEYSEHLEDLVAKRTKELQESLETIQKLKTLQDGDYFLMSLLIDPLIKNLNKSNFVKTEIFIKQKKEFEFKNKKREIGGDLCITGNLRFKNKSNEIERWVFFFNGDAMGKSSQGAGGVLVMGALLNAILARSAAKDRILEIEPLRWLQAICFEIQKIFLKFDGHMLISGAMGILSEHSGQMLYANFEHPKTILLRNLRASFIEEGSDFINYKFGFPLTNKLKIISFHLQPNDILILGSDGREDIILNDTNDMNRSEEYILPIVEEAEGDLEKIYNLILQKGSLTDDISLLKVHFMSQEITKQKKNLGTTSFRLNN